MNVLVSESGMGTGTGTGKRRGPKPKDQPREYVPKEDQRKFAADLGDEDEGRQLVLDLLMKANSKQFGREIIFKDLVVFAFGKLTDKDIIKSQENSLTSKEKAERVVAEYNLKHGTKLTLEEYVLCRDGK